VRAGRGADPLGGSGSDPLSGSHTNKEGDPWRGSGAWEQRGGGWDTGPESSMKSPNEPGVLSSGERGVVL